MAAFQNTASSQGDGQGESVRFQNPLFANKSEEDNLEQQVEVKVKKLDTNSKEVENPIFSLMN